jgi:peptidoglycan hydrolase CwlO-like protein
MPEPRSGRIGPGRSTGVVEHRSGTVLSRGRVLMVACIVALVSLPVSANAQSTGDRIAETRAAIDDVAQRYFDSQKEAEDLDAAIESLEQQVTEAQVHADETAVLARARALEIYKGSGSDFGPVLDSNDALDSVRRAELLDRANAQSERAIDDFEDATIDLGKKREELEARRASHTAALASLADEREQLESQLASLQSQAQAEAAARAQQAAAARASGGTAKAAKPIPPPRSSSGRSAAPVVVPPPPSSGGTHPHHDDPFLVCTRARESRGNYSVVSASGLYYGAYQFSPTTWNSTASHAGRLELVGVLPSQASVYDQDDMAWTLYQWQGKRPWGGRC